MNKEELINKVKSHFNLRLAKKDEQTILEFAQQYADTKTAELKAEKDREIPKWIPVTTKPEFDGEYLCSVIETEECGTSHIKQRVLSNHFNVWMVKANQSVLFWMPLPEQP